MDTGAIERSLFPDDISIDVQAGQLLDRAMFGQVGIRRVSQRHEAIEPELSGLIDDPHPALTQQLEDLQLRKVGCEVFRPEWQEDGAGGLWRRRVRPLRRTAIRPA